MNDETSAGTAEQTTVERIAEAGKWSAGDGAGPRMVKAVNVVLNKLKSQHNVHVELSGVIGYTGEKSHLREMRQQFLSIFGGGYRKDVAEAWNYIGNKYGWQVTQKNWKEIESETLSVIRRLEDDAPVTDKRRTMEEQAKRDAEMAEIYAKQEAESKARKEREQAVADEMAKKHPELQKAGGNMSSYALAASNIRRELGKAFPATTFRIRSSGFSGGSSVDIGWTDGPTVAQVEAISDKYEYGTFDAMTDCSGVKTEDNLSGFRDAFGSAKFVQTSRTETKEGIVKAWIQADPENHKAEDCVFDQWGLERDEQKCPLHMHIRDAVRDTDLSPARQARTVTVTHEGTTNAEAVQSELYRIETHPHTKRGIDMHMVILTKRVERAEFETLRNRAKGAGGWYSRQWGRTPGGFAFESRQDAEVFATSIEA